MKNFKSTKNALILSVLSLLLCVSMLVGTTYAWFTDSVTSSNNIIASGNLDVELEYSKDFSSWTTIKDSTEIFDKTAHWEPGYTEVVYLKVSNLGSLALRYQFALEIKSEDPGTNADGDPIKLSEHIKFGVVKDVTAKYTERADAIDDIDAVKKLAEGYTDSGEIKSGDPAKYMALVVYMPTTVTNEANHNGTDVPSIALGLKVKATQLNTATESDSFGSDYDMYAEYADGTNNPNISVGTAVELKTALLQSFDRVSKIAQDRAAYAGLQTNFRDLDKVLSGFGKSDLILLAARPGLGKTSLALNIAQNVGLQGKTVAIFSLEMSNEQLANRLLASHSGVDNKKFRTGELTSNEWVRLGQSSSLLAKASIYLDDTPDMTVAQMKAKLRRLPSLDLVIVDYMQLMSSGTKTASRQEAVSEISRSMKMMAKEFDVPVLCLSQLSRASEKREGDKRPMPSDLRESGSIEQDADAILFLYNDAIYNKETANPNKIELIIAKNRHGPTETVYLSWNNTLTKFGNYKSKKDAIPLPDEAPPV